MAQADDAGTGAGTGRELESPSKLHSPKAERSMIGACTLSSEACEVLMRELSPTDFYVPAHQRYAEAVVELTKIGAQVDTVTIAGWVTDRYGAHQGTLVELTAIQAETASSRSAPTYAARIRDRAARRQLWSDLQQATQDVLDLGTDVEEAVERLEGRLRAVDVGMGVDPPPLTLEQFLAKDLPYRWLAPNLLERSDRVIITSTEGAGKSTLLRQMAVQLAMGLHPFARQMFEPVTTLVVDVENSEQQAQRGFWPLFKAALSPDHQTTFDQEPPPAFDANRVHIEVRQQGIDLLSRRDRQWFTSRVEMARPDVILTGPLYKLFRGDPIKEEPAAQLAGYFDELRTRFDCALILEAHSPYGTDGGKHRTLRPFGASLWSRWPEFGFGIRPSADAAETGNYDLVSWRGARDASRIWPRKLRQGRTWPWINALMADYDMEPAF